MSCFGLLSPGPSGIRSIATFVAPASASVALLSRSGLECCVVESETPQNPQQRHTRRRDSATARHSVVGARNNVTLAVGTPQQHDIRWSGPRNNTTLGGRNPQQRHTRRRDPATTRHSVVGARNNATLGAPATASVALLSPYGLECCVVESETPLNPQQRDTRRTHPATTRHSAVGARNNATFEGPATASVAKLSPRPPESTTTPRSSTGHHECRQPP